MIRSLFEALLRPVDRLDANQYAVSSRGGRQGRQRSAKGVPRRWARAMIGVALSGLVVTLIPEVAIAHDWQKTDTTGGYKAQLKVTPDGYNGNALYAYAPAVVQADGRGFKGTDVAHVFQW